MSTTAATYGNGGDDDGFTTIAGGVIVRRPSTSLTPFIHALVGGAEVSGPFHNPNTMGLDLTLGGGVDYETHFFNHKLAFRLIQADYEYHESQFWPGQWECRWWQRQHQCNPSERGFVLHSGEFAPPTPVTLAVSVSPASVFPGEAGYRDGNGR